MKKLLHFFLFILQFVFYYLITPLAFLLYKRKKAWIVCERGSDARDNGYAIFKYICSNHQYINIYYLIKFSSPDYKKVKALGNTVRYKSLKHWLLYRVAECRMSTHLLCGPGNFINEWFKHHKQKGINVYLQHGITHNLFPSSFFENNGSDLFICGAKEEYEHVKKECKFPKDNVVYTGFPRFDDLHEEIEKNCILIMPTWRSYLHDLSYEDFKKSTFFLTYDNLLRNNKLIENLENKNMSIVFYLHYSLQKFRVCFSGYNKIVKIASFKKEDVQLLLKESKLLITDYSSVFFDFSYMYKPVIYYQFDYNDFYSLHYKHSYYDHKKQGFGEVVNDEDTVVETVAQYSNNNYKIKNVYKKRIDVFFPLHDSYNSKRVYDAIIDKIIDKNFNVKKNKKPTYLIFNGDDYGRNVDATVGINKAFEKGYIQQASLMVNRNPEDQLFIDNKYKNNLSLHFNIMEGNKMYDLDGEWFYFIDDDTISKRINSRKSFFHIDEEDKNIIRQELSNQIKEFAIRGNNCISFDSHGNIHNRVGIAKIMIPTLKEAGFKVARIPNNISNKHIIFNLTYKKYVSNLYRKNFITCDYFCSCYDFIHLNINNFHGKIIEIMTHPYMDNGTLVNRRDIDFESIQRFISKFNTVCINSYDLIKIKSKK